MALLLGNIWNLNRLCPTARATTSASLKLRAWGWGNEDTSFGMGVWGKCRIDSCLWQLGW